MENISTVIQALLKKRRDRFVFHIKKILIKIYQELVNMENTIIDRLRELMENEARSCSMDFGCITPLYVYRAWGGTVAIDEIAAGLKELRMQGFLNLR